MCGSENVEERNDSIFCSVLKLHSGMERPKHDFFFCPNQNQHRPKYDFFVQIKINTGQNQQAKWEEHGLAAARACWAAAARAGRRTRLSTSQTFFSHAWINV
jgi:hypothetical protein